MNHSRGHETKLHQQLKLSIGVLLVKMGYDILFEQKGCDVVGIKRLAERWLFILGVEIQLNNKNTCRNVRRNLANGANAVLIVTTSELLKAAVARKLSKEMSEEMGNRVGVTVIKTQDAR